MLNTNTQLGDDDNTATFAKVCLTENCHTKGGEKSSLLLMSGLN